MKIYVCCKHVPDVAMPFQIKEGRLLSEDLNYVLNAYDASSVEAALVLKETHEAEVSLVLIGPDKGKEALRKGLAMGADNAYHICDAAFEGSDSHAYAQILFQFFSDREYDFILCGKQSQDMDMGLTGGMLAQKLSIPYVTNAVGLEVDSEAKSLTVKRQGDLGAEMVQTPFPSIVTCSNDMNDPRIPSLKGIMTSKKKPMEVIDLAGLGLEESQVGSSGSSSAIVSWSLPPERQAGLKLEGDPEEIVTQLMEKLTTEAKVL
ncbi:electron transfer flavoprotein subunit beta/FixA family protein [bacterium]|jgi:electron transfer flavoprotein beta subunit|nr:electron transfer flavoprotein subunit beta/FixA family protein [bacterium]